jgi:microcystin-dependent protein
MDPYIGEIRALGFNWVPAGWLACNGQSVPINPYQALYAVIGTTYGPATSTTFTLPNLNPTPVANQPGLAMVGTGQAASGTTYALGKVTGQASVALTNAQLPAHGHSVNAVNLVPPAAPVPQPTATTYPSRLSTPTSGVDYVYTTDSPCNTTLNPAALGLSGTAGSHDNHQPYLAVNFCINYDGTYPQPAA